MDALFDGTHSFAEVQQGVPASPQELLQPEMVRLLSQPTGKLAEAAKANDGLCAGWEPEIPVRLYHGTADKDVPFANSERCQQLLAASGGEAELVNVGPLDHNGSAFGAIPQIADWFAERG
ncbi:lipase family protein [Saccharopolyspora sp. NPDC050389]|uniref:alpha/beta hydrolase family protein n=1 Tax=Saccharopolyspora sp. NPDC050389 TaxID=3155516 RepID=UPI003400C71A